MIVNELQYSELLDFLRPILRLESRDTIGRNCDAILKMPIGTTTGAPRPDHPLLRYKGYKLDVLHFRWFDAKGIAIQLHFKTRKKWSHGIFKDQNAELIGDLRRLCTSEIDQLTFKKYDHTASPEFGITESIEKFVFFHDARALNRRWRHAFDISPLLVSPDAHHGQCFVEFFSWGGAYVRNNGMTHLRPNWLDYSCDVSQDIEREANRRLGIQ